MSPEQRDDSIPRKRAFTTEEITAEVNRMQRRRYWIRTAIALVFAGFALLAVVTGTVLLVRRAVVYPSFVEGARRLPLTPIQFYRSTVVLNAFQALVFASVAVRSWRRRVMEDPDVLGALRRLTERGGHSDE